MTSDYQIAATKLLQDSCKSNGVAITDPTIRFLLSLVIGSDPPVGKCKVTNIYIDPSTGKVILEYNSTPNGG